MICGFPAHLIENVRCTEDAGILHINGSEKFIIEGDVECSSCGKRYQVSGGILDLLNEKKLFNSDSIYEREQRDREVTVYRRSANSQEDIIYDKMEIEATLKRLDDFKGKTVLEFGAGSGRYTTLLAKKAKDVVAVDFSMESLKVQSRHVEKYFNIGFVHGDVADIKLTPNSFDLSLSTLYSNLPSKEIRKASTKVIANALQPCGRYILSAHNQDLVRIIKNVPTEGRYENGIFCKYFTKTDLMNEIRPYFENIRIEPVCIILPYIGKILELRQWVSKIAERMPIINKFGSIVLAVCTK